MKPTEKEIKEFWEWCGFTTTLDGHGVTQTVAPNGAWLSRLPDLDLNNLFKWAVPKIKGLVKLSKSDNHTDYIATVSDYELNQEGKIANPDPALTLFWAIHKVIEDV